MDTFQMHNTHSLSHVVAFLSGLKDRGSYGHTVITWRGTDIPIIEHTEKYIPGGLPNTSAPVSESHIA